MSKVFRPRRAPIDTLIVYSPINNKVKLYYGIDTTSRSAAVKMDEKQRSDYCSLFIYLV